MVDFTNHLNARGFHFLNISSPMLRDLGGNEIRIS